MTVSRVDRLEQDAKSAVTSMADKASHLASKAGQRFDEALEGAESAANAVAQQSREAGERVGEVAGNLKTAVDRSVKDQPMATLAVAAALGFVIGAIWKS